MNWNVIEGCWKQCKGTAREQWGKLTNDPYGVIAGRRELLAGKMQESYGWIMDKVDKQIRAVEERYEAFKDRQRKAAGGH